MAREQRLVFGEDAEAYDRWRPSYPDEVIDDVLGAAGPLPLRAVDAGCGTGRATALLAERGVTGIGVEPHPAMAERARATLGRYPGWRVDESDFEAWSPRPDDTPVDLVTAAQAWHWLDPTRRLDRVCDVLRTDGVLAVWWNLPITDDDRPVRRAIDAAYAEYAPDLPHRSAWICGRPADPQFDDRFSDVTERRYPWSRRYTASEWINLLSTSSDHRMLDDGQRERLFAAIAAAIDAHGGDYEHHYETSLWTARRR